MLELLRKNFTGSQHYLISQTDAEEINRFVGKSLLQPFEQRRRQGLWGAAAKKLPEMGRKIGWVPNAMVATFLNGTAELEIADSCAAADNLAQPRAKHLQIARTLMHKFNMNHLANQNPFLLSEGEAKLLWFLTQWVKRPEYLIVGYLPTNLSRRRIERLIEFLLRKTEGTGYCPTLVMGYLNESSQWCAPLLESHVWKKLNSWPVK